MISIVLVGAVLVFSFGPRPPGQSIYKHIDKVEHFALYAAVTSVLLLLFVWRQGRGAGRFPSAELVVVGGMILLAIAVELLQGLLGGRDSDVLDAVASGAGVLMGYADWFALRRARS